MAVTARGHQAEENDDELHVDDEEERMHGDQSDNSGDGRAEDDGDDEEEVQALGRVDWDHPGIFEQGGTSRIANL